MSKKKSIAFALLLCISGPALAAGGLDKATNELVAFKLWLYGFMAVGAALYLMYHIIWAALDKKPWGDVLVALGRIAMAGGCLGAGEFAWAIWGN